MALPKRIMIVDDEEGIRDLLFEVLTDSGFKVTLARDGQESLDRLKKSRFDLLITDINMPRVDGIEMLKRMKRAGRQERIIIMTGNPTVDHTRYGEDIPPVFTKLNKPFRVNNFMEVVSSALTHKENRGKKKVMMIREKSLEASHAL